MPQCRHLLAMVAAALLGGCATIEPGSLGVVTDTFTGSISEKPLPAGFHIVGFFKQIYEFPAGVVDNINLDNFRINTREGQEVTVDIRVQYKPDLSAENAKATQLFQRYRKPFQGDHGLVQTRWIPVIQQAAGYAFSQQGVIELYQSRGARAANSIRHILQNGLKNKDVEIDGIGDDFVTVETVAISDIVLPEGIKNAVERKAQIEQETLTAKQNLEKSRMEAEKLRIEAHAEADAKFIRAQGEAKSRSALGITPDQYIRLETAKLTTDAIKNAPNLVIVPANSILDTRALMGVASDKK